MGGGGGGEGEVGGWRGADAHKGGEPAHRHQCVRKEGWRWGARQDFPPAAHQVTSDYPGASTWLNSVTCRVVQSTYISFGEETKGRVPKKLLIIHILWVRRGERGGTGLGG